MKNLLYLLIIFLGLSSCITNYYTVDDIYYTPPKTPNEIEYSSMDSSEIIMNNITYYEDDVFIVESDYTTRIKRFHYVSFIYLPYYHDYWYGNFYYYANYYDYGYYHYYNSTFYPTHQNYLFTFNYYNPPYSSTSMGLNSYYGKRNHISSHQKKSDSGGNKIKRYPNPTPSSRPTTPKVVTPPPRSTVTQRPTPSSHPTTPKVVTPPPRSTVTQRPTPSSRPATPNTQQPKTYSRPQSDGHATYRRN